MVTLRERIKTIIAFHKACWCAFEDARDRKDVPEMGRASDDANDAFSEYLRLIRLEIAEKVGRSR